jgi:MraZ protein
VVMFRGNSFHTLDEKGRIIIPSRFRDIIRAGGGDALMVTRMDKSLLAYSLQGWSKIEERLLSLADISEHMRRIRRYLVGGAFECGCDKQGRVLIPPTLRSYANLDKEIVLVGLLDHFEIWSRDNWDNANEQMETDLQKGIVHAEIAKLGL